MLFLLLAIVAASIVLMLLRPGGIQEAYWVAGGAALLVLLRLMPLRLACKAVADGLDVYLFLVGMMLLSALAERYGVFTWLASRAVHRANGSATRLFTLVFAIGTITTIFLSNDATAVVLTPAILTAVKRARARPLPCLFACAFISNAASFVLPVSNPANLVVFQRGMPTLGHWLGSFLLPSALAIAVTYAVLRVVFRDHLAGPIDSPGGQARLTPDGRLVLAGLALVSVVLLTASAINLTLGLPTFAAALAITLAVSFKSKSNPLRLARHISWSTLILVAGLFVLVRALEGAGALRLTRQAMEWVQTLSPPLSTLVAGLSVALLNNVVNNLPLGLLAGQTLAAAHGHGLLADTILVGVDLGPNLSVTGSLATILWLMALRRGEVEVTPWQFLKVGAIAMPAALIAALAGAWLMHALPA